LLAMIWLVVVDVVAACRAVRASAGFATVGHAHIRGLGTPRPLFVARPLSIVERGARLGVAQATNRGVVVREPGCSGRLASRNGKSKWGQRELVSLLRVMGVLVAWVAGWVGVGCSGQVAISQQ
jgi:hypothetical protein